MLPLIKINVCSSWDEMGCLTCNSEIFDFYFVPSERFPFVVSTITLKYIFTHTVTSNLAIAGSV